jgi:hypothetical protein
MNETTTPHFRNRSNDVAKIAAALSSAQKAFAPIPKDREVTVQTQTGGSYKFKYATFDAIRTATMPALCEQGLAIVQAMVEYGQGYAVETTLYHSSGEWLSNVTPMFVSGRTKDGKTYPPTNQELGSAQSYARRYGFSALLCITADEDDDANTADGNHIAGSERVPYKPRAGGSAGGGEHFRPDGPRRFQGNGGGWVGDARRDGIVNETRAKGTVPDKNPKTKQAVNAVELARWCKDSLTLFKTIETKPDLVAWWKGSLEKREAAEETMPAEWDRVVIAYDARMDTVAAKGA